MDTIKGHDASLQPGAIAILAQQTGSLTRTGSPKLAAASLRVANPRLVLTPQSRGPPFDPAQGEGQPSDEEQAGHAPQALDEGRAAHELQALDEGPVARELLAPHGEQAAREVPVRDEGQAANEQQALDEE